MINTFEHCQGCAQLYKNGTKCRLGIVPESGFCKDFESPSSAGEPRGISGRFATSNSQRFGKAWHGSHGE